MLHEWIVEESIFEFLLMISYILEIPALRVFLGADTQLLGSSLVGARMPLTISLKSHLIEYM